MSACLDPRVQGLKRRPKLACENLWLFLGREVVAFFRFVEVLSAESVKRATLGLQTRTATVRN